MAAATTYTTSAGDSWDSIAFSLWGDEFLMSRLLAANPEYSGVVVFDAGVILNVPVVDVAVASASLPPWKQGEGS